MKRHGKEAVSPESVVLKVRVSLQSTAGEPIAEIDTDHTFRNILGDHVLGAPDAVLEEMLDLHVATPCRALLRAHVDQLREQAGFIRLDQPIGPSIWDQAEHILAGLRRRMVEVTADGETTGTGDEAA